MKLDRLILVNWGQLQPGDYDLGNLTLLTGPTGAGKSTLLDGLQTVMTAAYQGIVAYNPGQEEVQQNQRRGKTKRTLESFVAGAEYSKFSRPDGAHGYVAAVFRPDSDEPDAQPFTAIVGVAARVDGNGERREAKLEKLVLCIVENAALTSNDFFHDRDAGLCVPVEEIARKLKSSYPKVTNHYDHKRDYLCALYGHFRGRPSIAWDETRNAARAWSQSIAYKPIGSVHDLVRDEILEFDAKALQESITRISDLMRQVSNLKQEGQRLESTVNRLRELDQAIEKTNAAFEEQVKLDLLMAKLRLAVDDESIATEQEKIQADQQLVSQCTQAIQQQDELKNSLDNNRIRLSAQLSGISAHTEKQTLDRQLEQAVTAARTTLNALHDGLLAAAKLKHVAGQLLEQALPEQLPKLKAAIAQLAQAMGPTDTDRMAGLLDAVVSAQNDEALSEDKLRQLSSAFNGLESGLSQLYAALAGQGEDSILMALASEKIVLNQQLLAARERRHELAERKQRLAAGAGNYNPATVQALQRIREHLPQAEVLVLCDLVEPVSDEWQAAIEGYMDGARFNLIVKPEWEAATIDLLRSMGSRSKVIQGQRCLDRADPNRVPGHSIIHELRTEHPIAQAYLVEQFGPVVKVDSSEALRHTRRGLTRDGKGSGSMTLFVCEQRDFVLGRKAREQALQLCVERLQAADDDIAELESLHETLQRLRQPLAGLKEPGFDAGPLAGHANRLQALRLSLAQLDLTEVEQLEAELARLNRQIKEHESQIDEAKKAQTLAEQRISSAEDLITRLQNGRSARLDEQEKHLQRLKQLCASNPQKTYTVMAQEVQDRLHTQDLDLAAVQQRLAQLRTLPYTLLGEVREQLAEYNSHARSDERFHSALPHLLEADGFDPYYSPLAQLGSAVHSMHTQLQSIGLYHSRTKVEEAEASFRDVFTKQFCVEIKSKVDEGVRTLRQLNNELEKLKFGTDRFSIDWSKWEPEFQEYYRFFSAVAQMADSADTPDLFGPTELDPALVEVRDRLVALLLDQDQDRAGRELLRIADYRNYRRYEIWNDSDSGGRIALSEWGTGSGGQLETPAYIVRAAVVTNRLKLFEKGSSLKLLVNDESFSKMDEARARTVLRYLNDHLGLQIISAMPTRNAGGLRPEFNREYSFSRLGVPQNGELDFVIECDERIFDNDRMRELWERQRQLVRAQAQLAFETAEAAQAQAQVSSSEQQAATP